MNCTSCEFEITNKHDTLQCFGLCGHKYHYTCLSSRNKYYKKPLITALNEIQNLLWFCDECLPNITAAFAEGQQQQQSHQNLQTDQIPLTQSQQIPMTQQHPEQSNILADLVFSPPTISDSIQVNITSQMETDEQKETESTESIQSTTNGKRRRISIDSVATDSQSSNLSEFVTSRISSTNYRCIYLTKFKPSTVESDIIAHINSCNRDNTEIIECKKLIPQKCNTKKVSFVSFKLTVHKEFFNVYIDQSFWPNGVTPSEFVVRPPKTQIKSQSKQFRVNPFAFRRPQQNKPTTQKSIATNKNKRLNTNNTHKNHFNSNSNFNLHNMAANSNSNNRRQSNRKHQSIPSPHSNFNPNSNFKPNRNGSSTQNQKNHRAPFNIHTLRPGQRQMPQHNKKTPLKSQPVHRGPNFMGPEQLMMLKQMLDWQLSSLMSRF